MSEMGYFLAAACSDVTDKIFAEPPMDPASAGRRLGVGRGQRLTDDSVVVTEMVGEELGYLSSQPSFEVVSSLAV